jgi:hypothetical protein
MLFDLRGRGRRRVVKVIYIGLAALFAVGFVGFGVGSIGSGGGLFSSLSSNEGSNAASFANQIKKYEKLTKQRPSDLQAWEGLTKNLLHEAGGEEFTTNTGVVTSKGKALYARASSAWGSYMALNPPKPSAELAQLMFTVYGEDGLERTGEGRGSPAARGRGSPDGGLLLPAGDLRLQSDKTRGSATSPPRRR